MRYENGVRIFRGINRALLNEEIENFLKENPGIRIMKTNTNFLDRKSDGTAMMVTLTYTKKIC